MVQKVWTFVVRRGNPFTLQLPQNPPLLHDGSWNIWKLVGTPRLAEMAKEIIEEQGATVILYTEEQTQEQARMRVEGPGDPDEVDS